MNIPTISSIRQSLADVKGALIDDPQTTKVNLGDVPHVPIHQPTDNSVSLQLDGFDIPPKDETTSPDVSTGEEPSIIFEIPPQLDDRVVKEALGRAGGRDFERMVQAEGTDALGWYFPFHYQIAQHGIYLSSRGSLELAIRCFRHKYSDDPREDVSKKIHYATHAILRHETFHFAAECMAASWELATGTPCYIQANRRLQNQAGYVEQEEALANAYMLRGFRWVSSATYGARATSSLKAFTKMQPQGYNRGTGRSMTELAEMIDGSLP
jgi:hypothetical protein